MVGPSFYVRRRSSLSTETELNEFDKAYLYAPPQGSFAIPRKYCGRFYR